MHLAIAYDGSESAAAAIDAAAKEFPGARATVLTARAQTSVTAGMAGVAVSTLSPELVQRTLDEIDGAEADEAGRTAGEGVARARAGGLDATALTTRTNPPIWRALLSTTRDVGADVLVTGTRGRSGLARTLLGSTAARLLHHADLPLMIVPDGVAGALDGPALLAYDGSADAKHAVEVAGPLLVGREVIVAHAWESQYRHSLTARALGRGPVDDLTEIVASLEQALADHANSILADGVAAARDAGLTATGRVFESDAGVSRTLLAAAAEVGAGLLVTGSRGIGGARSALLGSVSSGLIHNADVPVLVVPAA
ncbi:universal stress protein [Solirubrobacter soli]|uniref:universal stress protein n=1 Tax=Solirubrobacter soli TaxID=363832 RepID=UPI000412A863|nr:universal stress protein [Solirubrobacter soli]